MLKIEVIKQAYCDYIELSKYLFGNSESAIYDINEMPEDNKFYTQAREISAQLDIDWHGMTHEESNRIMLALLEDVYQKIGATIPKKERKNLVVELTFKMIKKQ